MRNFYYLSVKNDSKIATLSLLEKYDEYELWDKIEGFKDDSEWEPVEFQVKGDVLTDYPPSDSIGRICSIKLKEVLESVENNIIWLPLVLEVNNENIEYYHIHFLNSFDALDEKKSKYIGHRVISPYLSLEKLKNVHALCLGSFQSSLIIDDVVKEKIENESLVGVSFEKLPSS